MSEVSAKLHMPDAEAAAVREAYRSARSIIEYGSGGSTIFAATDSTANLCCIESDPDWLAQVALLIEEQAPNRQGLTLRHVDVGPVGAWGVPQRAGAYRKFPNYALSPWVDPAPGVKDPDLVFVDGRFRLACFAATVLNAKAPLTLLWDDYIDRSGYHAGEALTGPPAEMIGRMALFEIKPRALTPAEISMMIPWFSVPA